MIDALALGCLDRHKDVATSAKLHIVCTHGLAFVFHDVDAFLSTEADEVVERMPASAHCLRPKRQPISVISELDGDLDLALPAEVFRRGTVYAGCDASCFDDQVCMFAQKWTAVFQDASGSFDQRLILRRGSCVDSDDEICLSRVGQIDDANSSDAETNDKQTTPDSLHFFLPRIVNALVEHRALSGGKL